MEVSCLGQGSVARVSDPFPVLQAWGGPGLHVSHGFTTLGLSGGSGLGMGGTPSESGAVCPLSALRTPSLGYQGGLGLTGMPSFSGLNPVPGLSDELNFMAFTVLDFPFPFLTHQEKRSRTDRAVGIPCLLYMLVRV